MQGGFVLAFGQLGAGDIVAVGLVDHNGVSHLQDAFLDTLQFITGTGDLQNQKKIHHRGDRGLRLTDADRLNDDNIKAGCLADQHGFPGLAGNAAEAAAGRGGTDEGHVIDRQLFHPGLVAENRTAAAGGTWIDGQYSYLMAKGGQHGAEALYEGALAGTRYTGNAQAHSLARVRQQLIDHMLGNLLMGGQNTFHQRDGPGQHQAIIVEDTLDVVTGIFMHI